MSIDRIGVAVTKLEELGRDQHFAQVESNARGVIGLDEAALRVATWMFDAARGPS